MSDLSEAFDRAEKRWSAMSDDQRADDRMWLFVLQDELRKQAEIAPDDRRDWLDHSAGKEAW